jgi:hypothetical protein
MIGDHHGRTAGRATLLLRAMDEILGTHRLASCALAQPRPVIALTFLMAT